MKELRSKALGKFATSARLQVIVYLFVILLMSNMNALVDKIFHPEIPYFDEEHLIVGGVTSLVSIFLFGFLFMYMRRLAHALQTIQVLESILPICSSCKKIRIIDGNPREMKSWQPIESYITQQTTTKFSHGICPECLTTLYPDYDDNTVTLNEAN
jgi:hypothetical protein